MRRTTIADLALVQKFQGATLDDLERRHVPTCNRVEIPTLRVRGQEARRSDLRRQLDSAQLARISIKLPPVDPLRLTAAGAEIDIDLGRTTPCH